MPTRVTTGVIVQQTTVPTMRPLAFQWRYTFEEQVAIDIAENTHQSATVRAQLRILRQSLEKADYVDVSDPRTRQGVELHAALGLIAPNRVAEILAAP